MTRKADGTWVVLVTSGYDNGTDSPTKSGPATFVANSPAGNGKGYLYVLNAATGAIISKISTGVGTAAAPSGLAKIAGYNVESGGNKVSYVYGGDLLGNLWRFDINDRPRPPPSAPARVQVRDLARTTADRRSPSRPRPSWARSWASASSSSAPASIWKSRT